MSTRKKTESTRLPRADQSFEFYDASEDDDQELGTLGLTWVTGRSINAMPVAEYMEEHLPGDQMRVDFLKHLPFKKIADVPWPLPGNPCRLGTRTTEVGDKKMPMNLSTVAEWEDLRGRTVFQELLTFYGHRVGLTKPIYYTTLALWTIAAALRLPEMIFAPSLLLQAPFGWGKTTTAEAVQIAAPRCIMAATISPAATYRVVNEYGPALVVDESAILDNPDLQRVIKTGFKKGPKILRARQNADHGIVAMDPWTFLILTIQVNPRDDIMSRCLPVVLVPGAEPQVGVRVDDPDAKQLRTVLMKLRLEARAGQHYADFRAVAAEVRALEDLEPRTKDKIESLWPIAKKYGCAEELVEIAHDAEEIAKGQYEMSDEGIVATALQDLVESSRGEIKAEDLLLTRIHAKLTALLLADGEGESINTFSGEVTKLPRGKYGARDFTAPILRKLGFRTKLIHGQTCIDLWSFKSTWPAVQRRYIDRPVASQSHLSLPSLPTDTASGQSNQVEIHQNISTSSLPTPPSRVEMVEINNVRSSPKSEVLATPQVEMVEINRVEACPPDDEGARRTFSEILDGDARRIFDEKFVALQGRFDLADKEFGANILRESIEYVAETRVHGDRPSPYRLRSHLTTKFTNRAKEATGAVDLYFTEISELADMLRQPGGVTR